MGDQAISSLTNFVIGVYAAHQLTPDAFGHFALWSAVYIVVLGVTRSAFSEVAVVSFVDAPRMRLGAVDLNFFLWTACSAILLLIAAWDHSLGSTALAASAILIMTWQDSLRVVSINLKRPSVAFVSDLSWLVALLLAMLFPVWRAQGAEDMMILWGVCALPGVAIAAFANSWRPLGKRAQFFMHTQRKMSVSLSVDWALKQGSSQVAVYGLGYTGGLSSLAGIRAGLLLLGPLNIFFTGIQMAIMPRAVSEFSTSPARVRRRLRATAISLAALSVGAGIVAFFLPDSIIALVLGQQAEVAKDYILPLAFGLAASALAVSSTLELRIRRASLVIVRLRALASVTYLGCGLLGYLAFESVTAGLWGLAVGGLVGVALHEWALYSEMS